MYFSQFLAFAVLCSISLIPEHNAADCKQQFNFFFKSCFTDVFWVGESMDGECQSSSLLQIITDGEEVHSLSLSMKDFNDWKWVESAGSYFRKETVVQLEQKFSTFKEPVLKLRVKPPQYNETLYNQYLTTHHNLCAPSWNERFKGQGVTLPRVSGKKIEKLVYYYPKGLYFNYAISEVYFFPDTNYLLVFIKNPLRCEEGKTMDGFLILKVS